MPCEFRKVPKFAAGLKWGCRTKKFEKSWSKLIPRISGCFAVGSVCLFNLNHRVVPYSVESGVKSVVVVLSVSIQDY